MATSCMFIFVPRRTIVVIPEINFSLVYVFTSMPIHSMSMHSHTHACINAHKHTFTYTCTSVKHTGASIILHPSTLFPQQTQCFLITSGCYIDHVTPEYNNSSLHGALCGLLQYIKRLPLRRRIKQLSNTVAQT